MVCARPLLRRDGEVDDDVFLEWPTEIGERLAEPVLGDRRERVGDDGDAHEVPDLGDVLVEPIPIRAGEERIAAHGIPAGPKRRSLAGVANRHCEGAPAAIRIPRGRPRTADARSPPRGPRDVGKPSLRLAEIEQSQSEQDDRHGGRDTERREVPRLAEDGGPVNRR